MEAKYSPHVYGLNPTIEMRYGQEPQADELWKKIVEIEDDEKRNKQIDNLVELLSLDCEKTGFFDSNTPVVVRGITNRFVLDDNEAYYDFFKTLRSVYVKNLEDETNYADGKMISHSIKATLRNYFGEYKGGNKQTRMKATESYYDTEKDDFVFPSIKNQKGKNCACCAEHASLAHNLWLMTGKTSYYIESAHTELPNVGKEFENDGHVFCIVEYDKKFRLFDPDMQNFAVLEGNPIEKLLKGEALNVSGPAVSNPGTYGLTGMEKEKKNS